MTRSSWLRAVPTRRMIVQSAVSHIHSVHDGESQRFRITLPHISLLPPLEVRVLGLQPCPRPATHIPRANALRDDCFEVHPARMTKAAPSPVIRSASHSSRPLNASCAVPEAQGARPACPPPPPKNPLNADSETAPVVLERRQWPMEPEASLQQEPVRVSRVCVYALPFSDV